MHLDIGITTIIVITTITHITATTTVAAMLMLAMEVVAAVQMEKDLAGHQTAQTRALLTAVQIQCTVFRSFKISNNINRKHLNKLRFKIFLELCRGRRS